MLHLTSCWWFHIYHHSFCFSNSLQIIDLLTVKHWPTSLHGHFKRCKNVLFFFFDMSRKHSRELWYFENEVFCCCLSNPSCMLHCFSKLGYTEQLCKFDRFLWLAYNKFCSNRLTSISGVLWWLIFFNSEKL